MQPSGAYPWWYSSELKQKIIQKNFIEKTLLDSDYIMFNKVRAECLNCFHECYKKYVYSIESSVNLNLRCFWAYVKNLKKDNKVPSSMFLGSKEAGAGDDIVRLFSTHFE